MSFNFKKGLPDFGMYVKGLFQVINNNILQTKAQNWRPNSYFEIFQSSNVSLPLDAISRTIQSPFLDIFDWIVFASPGSIIAIKLTLLWKQTSPQQIS